jgi:pimeloyl-ACP methyl ester carboxylesterase
MPQININSNLTDALSPAAHDVLNLDKPTAYTQLVVTASGNQPAGNSLDGQTALMFALAHPERVRKLILFDAGNEELITPRMRDQF